VRPVVPISRGNAAPLKAAGWFSRAASVSIFVSARRQTSATSDSTRVASSALPWASQRLARPISAQPSRR
jgi:hypothetical protein